jgi:hypothetical protein
MIDVPKMKKAKTIDLGRLPEEAWRIIVGRTNHRGTNSATKALMTRSRSTVENRKMLGS